MKVFDEAPRVRLVERVVDPFGNKAMVDEDAVLPQKSLQEWGFGETPEFSGMHQVDYDFARDNGYMRFAYSWDEVVREAVRAIGPEDAQAWVRDMSDIVNNPCFIRDMLPAGRFKARAAMPTHTLVQHHGEAWHKLGYFRVFRPGQRSQEVYGADAVRAALLENHMRAL